MASLVTHALIGPAGGRLATGRRMPRRFWAALVVLSMLPDLDGIGHMRGVPYGAFFGHRGFFHSPFFALLAGTAAAFLLFWPPTVRIWLAFVLVGASHGILDAMTDGGLGVALLSPFDATRYWMPFRPLAVSPIGIAPFFSEWGLRVLASELVYVWWPVLVLLAVVEYVRRRSTGGAGPG